MKILCIGHATYDFTHQIDEFPKEGLNYKYNIVNKCGGGVISNASYLLGKWNVPNTFAGVIGNDEYGSKIKQEFNSVRVDTRFIETDYNHSTNVSNIYINKINGMKTILESDEDFTMLTKYSYDFIPDIIVTDANDFLAVKSLINTYPEAKSILVANKITEEIIEIAKRVKIIMCSKDFAEGITKMTFDFNNATSISKIYQELRNQFKNDIIINLGEKGAIFVENTEIKFIPGIVVKEKVDGTGGEDIFYGGVLYAMSQDYNMTIAISLANIASGLSSRKLGGRTSIPDFNEVKAYYEQKKGTLTKNNETTPANPIPNPVEAQPVQPTQTPIIPSTTPVVNPIPLENTNNNGPTQL